MKDKLMALAMAGVLALGFWSLSTRPARADILCLVSCVNDYADCIGNVKIGCGIFGDNIACLVAGTAVCRIIRDNCNSGCGPCPI